MLPGHRFALLAALGSLVVAAQARIELRRRREAEERLRAFAAEVERRVRERSRELSFANDLKDRFLATVSHELRTPLNAILGWGQLLKSGRVPPAEARRAVEAIVRNAQAQVQIVNQLLDVSRMVQGRVPLVRVPVELGALVRDAVASAEGAATARALRLTVELPSEPLHVLGDAGRLSDVLHHLLSNAIRFTPNGGDVIVTLKADDGRAELRVRDTGIGLAPDALPHVFTPFYQKGAPEMRSGLGLGLTLVEEVVQRHGGRVRAESDGPDRGATFVVSLPLTRVATAAQPMPRRRGESPRASSAAR